MRSGVRAGVAAALLLAAPLGVLGQEASNPGQVADTIAAPPSQEPAAPGAALDSVPAPAQAVPVDPVLARLDSLAASIRDLTATQDSLAGLLAETGRGRTGPAAADTTLAFGPDLEATARGARRFGLLSMVAVLILIVAFLLVRTTSWVLDRLSERSARRRLLFKRLVPIVRVLVWALAILFILRGVFDLDAQTLLAAGAGVGVAIGFAAQDLLKNVFGGLVIIGDRPFQVGDKIAVGDNYGEVISIGLRSTKIQTPDDNLVTVPNSLILSGQVSNANAGALDCQVVTDLYLPGWVNIRRAKEIAYRAAATSRYVFLKKPIVVIVKDEVHHTFLTHLRVKAYVQDIRHEFLFMTDVAERARAAFVEEGLLPAWHGATAFADFDGHDGEPAVARAAGTERRPERGMGRAP